MVSPLGGGTVKGIAILKGFRLPRLPRKSDVLRSNRKGRRWLGAFRWKRQNFVDVADTGGQHQRPVEAQGYAGAAG